MDDGELTTNQKGAIAEWAVIREAVERGIDVYRPLTEGGRTDFILGIGRTLVRVQCKWAVRSGDVIVVRLHSSSGEPAEAT